MEWIFIRGKFINTSKIEYVEFTNRNNTVTIMVAGKELVFQIDVDEFVYLYDKLGLKGVK